MNQDKAREYFSAYYEGNLERGLRQTMEQRLRADAQLQAEYRAFQRTMDQLDNLKFEQIEAPSYLSDRIATKIEQARVANRPKNPFLLWLPRYAVAGLAAVALVGAAIAIFSNYRGHESPAGIGLTGGNIAPPVLLVPPSETVTVSGKGQHVTLHYQSAIPRSVQVLDASGTKVMAEPLIANQQLNANLANPNPDAVLFEIKVSDSGPDVHVAVPGTKRLSDSKDSGSIADFAAALADTFQAPIIVNVPDLTKTVSWTLAGADERAEALKALEGTDYEVSQTASGVLSITKRS